MLQVKTNAVRIIHNFLRARNVPESQWPERVKKTGREMLSTRTPGTTTATPASIIPLPGTIAMQVCYASLIGLGVLLAFDEKKPEGRG